MKIVIVGHGVEGRSAEAYWKQQGAEVAVRDRADGPDYLKDLDQFDLIVRSPGIRPDQITTANPGLEPAKITSGTNEFLEHCPAPVIGVTGTKGKGTTATLIAKILEAAGQTVHLGGNIGVPALDLLPQIKAQDYVVLELSSFQLMDVRRSPHIAVILMVTEDHLDWHVHVPEYVISKSGIIKFQSTDDLVVYNADNQNATDLAKASKAHKLPFSVSQPTDGAHLEGEHILIDGQSICRTDEVGLVGAHNLQNVCAAISATWGIVQDTEPIATAIKEFTGLPHRLEVVATVNGVTYIDDSVSTNPDTATAAIRAFDQPKILILGGSDKGHTYDHLAEAVKAGKVRKVILIGATAPDIQKALEAADYHDILLGTGEMEAVVELAAEQAEVGDIVLLSPACASFGLFKNYKDRGDQFAAAARALP